MTDDEAHTRPEPERGRPIGMVLRAHSPSPRSAVLALTALLYGGCDLPATNPFDPAAPASVQAPATLAGVVSGAAGPLESARVRVLGAADDVEQTTGADGSYAAELAPGNVTVEVTHPAHLRFVLAVSLVAGQERALDITLEPLPQVAGDDVGHLFGTVVRSGQLTLPAAQQDHSGIIVEVEGTGVRAVTALSGAFDLFLAPGSYDLSLSTTGHDELVVADVVVAAGATSEVPGSPFSLVGVPGSVSGVVLLEDGAVPDGIGVDLSGGGSGNTDATGGFVIGGVAAGSYPLTASKDGYEPLLLGFVAVEPARETVLPALVLQVSRGVVRGTALLAGANAHDGIVVQLAGGGGAAVTDVDGAFTLEGVREGSYTLRASRDGFAPLDLAGVSVVANRVTTLPPFTLAAAQGDFAIDDGAPFTADREVQLEIEGEGAVTMRISEDSSFADATRGDVAFRAFVATPTVSLSSGDGSKPLFVQLKDAGDVVGPTLSASIILDETAPAIDAFTIAGGSAFTSSANGIVSLSISGSDATSGVVALQLSNDDVLDEPFEPFTVARVHTLEAPTDDGAKTVRLRLRDAAGNVSTVSTATITLDRAPPTLTSPVRIDCAPAPPGSAFCSSPVVSVHVASTDAVAVALSNQSGLPNAVFGPHSDDVPHVLIPGDGLREVFVLLRDAAGNVSSPFSDDVTVDATPPTLATVLVAGGADAVNDEDVTVALGAQGASSMRVAFDGVLDTEPVQAFAPTLAGALPTGDGTKTVVAVFLDDAGNASAVAADTVVLDKTPPSAPTLSVDGGAAFTRSVSVALTLSAQGASLMRVRTDGAFDAETFVPLAQNTVALLPAGDCVAVGCKTVCAEFADAAGNVSATACDSITLDGAAPAVPVITSTSGVVSASAFTLALAAQPADAFFGGFEVVVDPGDNGVFTSRTPLAGSPPRFALTLRAPSTADPALAATTNLVRIRAFDQAANRSGEATLAVTVDNAPPAVPQPTVASATVNADTFAVFFGAGNLSANDATFSRYEIAVVSPARPTPVFTPTALEDGVLFTLEQGDDVGCSSPCANQLQLRARDAAGNVSGVASVAVAEDSTLPTRPRLSPRGARITGIDALLRLEEISNDNGAEAVRYELLGGTLSSFTEVTGPLLPVALNRRDFSHEVCVRGKDAAGNVSSADCVVIEQLTTRPVASDGVDESEPAIFGDLVLYTDAADGLRAHELRSGTTRVLDQAGRAPRLDGAASAINAAWVDGVGKVKHVQYPIDGLGAAVATLNANDPDSCIETCALNLSGADSVDVSVSDIVIHGSDNFGRGIFTTTLSACNNQVCDGDIPGDATRRTPQARDIALCDGREPTGVRVHDGVAVWCEVTGGVQQVHRLQLASGVDTTIATAVLNNGEDAHQPVVIDSGLYWGSGADLCRIGANDVVATPFNGCPLAKRVPELAGQLRVLSGGDEDRLGLVVGGAATAPKDAATFDDGDNVLEQLSDDIFEQTGVQVWRDRVAYSDRQRFSDDVVVREGTEGTWVIADPAIQAGPQTDGRFITWVDTRRGFQLMAYDLVTGAEIEVTARTEALGIGGDSLYSLRNGVVAYMIATGGVSRDLFVENVLTGQRVLAATSATRIEAAELNETATRVVWSDATDHRIHTKTVSGSLVLGADALVAGTTTRVTRMAVAQNTVIFEDQGPLGCADIGSTTTKVIDNFTRGVGAATVTGLGVVAAWGIGDSIRSCVLTCGATVSCPVDLLATGGGGSTELPQVSASGFITWQSNQDGDDFGQIAVYDLLRDVRYRIATDFGVDGPAPVNGPFIHGDRIVWSGFAFGTSDVFTAVLGD